MCASPHGSIIGLVIEGGVSELHDFGIGGIKDAFDIRGFGGAETTTEQPRQIGAEIRRVRRIPRGIRFTLENGWSRLVFCEGTGHPFSTALPANGEEGVIYGAWDDSNFVLAGRRDMKGLIHRVMLAFEDQDILICLSDAKGKIGHQMLGMFIMSAMSQNQLNEFENHDRAFLDVRDQYLTGIAAEQGGQVLKRRVLGGPGPQKVEPPAEIKKIA